MSMNIVEPLPSRSRSRRINIMPGSSSSSSSSQKLFLVLVLLLVVTFGPLIASPTSAAAATATTKTESTDPMVEEEEEDSSVAASEEEEDDDDDNRSFAKATTVQQQEEKDQRQRRRLQQQQQQQQQRLHDLKMELWSSFGYSMLDETFLFGNSIDDVDENTINVQIDGFQKMLTKARFKKQYNKLTPRTVTVKKGGHTNNNNYHHQDDEHYISPSRRQRQNEETQNQDGTIWNILRGGGSGEEGDDGDLDMDNMEIKIQQLSLKYGPDFVEAIERNKQEHLDDCQTSCKYYYCEDNNESSSTSNNDDSIIDHLRDDNGTTIRSYSFGAVPPEDFASDFGFPLDLIHVTQNGQGLFSKEEADQVIQVAKTEGVDHNEYKSGKYKLGGNWLTELPKTRQWFNDKLRTTFFPLLAELFPEIVSSTSVLRAHSVSLLKYNTTHPRTDVHIDNGILAITVAMTPKDQYVGGGTFMEHFVDVQQTEGGGPKNQLIEMDVGHATLRPGSVRHGGHRVVQGERYILGAFLLIEDRVEHVRRLKNRGAKLRTEGKLDEASRYFEWGLALNPKCTTCLKDWAEILHVKGDFIGAEEKLRTALDLLEYKDSDALFTLGLVLSEQGGRDDECIDMYRRSLALNDEDPDLMYNLAIKIGDRHRRDGSGGSPSEEMRLYVRCTELDPNFGGAYLNLGTALAEQGNLDDAETMFQKAASTIGSTGDKGKDGSTRSRDNVEVLPKALVNLALIYHQRASAALQNGQIPIAKSSTLDAITYLDKAQPLLLKDGTSLESYRSQYKAIRMASHRNLGQIFAGSGDMVSCEEQFRRIISEFPEEIKAWQMLGRVLEVQGKQSEMQEVISKIQHLSSTTTTMSG